MLERISKNGAEDETGKYGNKIFPSEKQYINKKWNPDGPITQVGPVSKYIIK
jgi:hypothetical protein